MRNILFCAVVISLFCNCNSISGNREVENDSIKPYRVSSGQLNDNEYIKYNKALSSFFEDALPGKKFNGSILVAKNGVIVYEKYSGLIDLRKDDSITNHTAFHVASVSKPFTAMAILQMVQEKKISLEDSLSKFFPRFPYPGITVKMLLNHRSGLPNYMYFISESQWDKNIFVTNDDVLNQLYLLKPVANSPNTDFNYCNTNYVLLALIVERISGKSFPVYMREKFFRPLQMNDTYIFSLSDSLSATPSFNYDGTHWQNDFLEATYGDKNIYTTPRDLLRWQQVLLSGQIINRSLLDSSFTPYSPERKTVYNYGLGWRLAIFPHEKKLIYHFGRWHGFNAALAYLPDEKITIIVLGNRFTYSIYNAVHDSYSLFGDYWEKQKHLEEAAAKLKRLNQKLRSNRFQKQGKHHFIFQNCFPTLYPNENPFSWRITAMGSIYH